MSQTTFALPLIIADHVSHSHQHGRPSSRGHQRQSRSYRPLSLPSFNSSQGQSDTDTSHAGRAFIEESGHSYNNHNPGAVQWSQQHELKTRNGKQTPRSSRNMATHQHRSVSRFTEYLLRISESNALLHGVLLDEESRRIFYFMLLNLSFMLVQFSYGYLTGSLGLISDSIHMLFDCVALVVGVCAAVMSKWPPNAKFPYGYGKIDTLAGLGNGIFLMLISVEIVYEAVERLFEGNELERTNELLIVSFLGLVVNMVGIFAFHGHHGHHHGHDHGHSHGHAHDHKSSTAASASPTKAQEGGSHGHHHHHGENMQGIYLHIMADALGSLAVVLSTLLVQYTGWSGFDPLASCIIAVLIFASTVPLVSSTTKILLLSLNSDVEYNLREILSGVSNIRGVIGYTVPKFWIEDVKKDDHDHGHGHDHQHHHDHGHEHHDSRLHTHQDSHHNHQHHDDHHHAHDDHEHDSCTHNHSDHHSRLHAIEKHSHDTNDEPTIFGTIHIQISAYADLRDVQARVNQYFSARKMDVVVQYEREGDRKCWCSALTIGPTNIIRTPQTGAMRTPINGSFSSSLLNATSHMNGNSGKSGLVGKML